MGAIPLQKRLIRPWQEAVENLQTALAAPLPSLKSFAAVHHMPATLMPIIQPHWTASGTACG